MEIEKTKKRAKLNGNLLNFRADPDVLYYTKKNLNGTNVSKFINSAIRFYITWLNKPVKILLLAKYRYLPLYKYVLRKKFKLEELP